MCPPSERYRDYSGSSPIQQGKRDPMAQLEIAASIKNAAAFERILETSDWSGGLASDFIRVIHLALRMGTYGSARSIAVLAREHHPNDEQILRYNAVLAVPTVTRKKVPLDLSIRANRDWLKSHGDDHRGKWVALSHGHLLGVAESSSELIRMIGEAKDTLITKVY